MRLADLQQALHQVSPAAVLVTPQVLDKVIQQVGDLSVLPWSIPHRFSYVVDRQTLFRHIEQEDLDLNPEYLLPEKVLLLLRPTSDLLNLENPQLLLGIYWRRLFHASIHLEMEKRWNEGLLSREDIQKRIEEIGRPQFEEIRQILHQEQYLLNPSDDVETYIEFVAVFLEQRTFTPNLLPIFFPCLTRQDALEPMFQKDLDAVKLLNQTRLPGAPDPEVITDNSSDESHDYFHRLIRQADRSAEQGNLVRAAILRTKAARVAPASLTRSTRAEAEGHLHQLASRLLAALELKSSEASEWSRDLNSLLDKADQGSHPEEADLLFDLQKVCLDAEQGVFNLSVFDYLVSLGRRPLKRPLPCLRQVRILSHLQKAADRLTKARISDAERVHLSGLLQSTLKQGQERLRVRFRPIFEVALRDVGLVPSNPPEKVAFTKIIEELLDRILRSGYLTFSDLRDVISHNEVKIPDLQDPEEFLHGDPLLRLDRRLASLLDGVYRPSEIYSRFLERLTALSFGTHVGRWLTVWLVLPFGGAFVLLEGIKMLVEEILGKPLIRSDLVEKPELAAPLPPLLSPVVNNTLWLSLGLFFMALWHSQAFRHGLLNFLLDSFRIFQFLLFGLPLQVLRWPPLRHCIRSWPFQIVSWIVLKPGIVFLPLWLVIPQLRRNQILASLVFLLLIGVVNSSPGQMALQLISRSFANVSRALSVSLFLGLFSLIASLFKNILSLVEDVLFTVDEWMRFRTGENGLWIALRVILGILWMPIAFLIRFYLVVLIEPGINPLKFPVSTVAAKFLLPLTGILLPFFVASLRPILGAWLANLLGVTTFFLLPDAFGYLFWELKENWSLYQANRSQNIRPMSLGQHGETLLTLLEPGIHSGTIPRLFTRWRRAEREAIRTRNWRIARGFRQNLEEIQDSIRLFVTRNFIHLLSESRAWKAMPPRVGQVAVSCSQIQIELLNCQFPGESLWLEFQEKEGWLSVKMQGPQWFHSLPPEQKEPLNLGLQYLFKLGGVSLIQEQILSQLPGTSPDFDIRSRNLVVWGTRDKDRVTTYDWRNYRGKLLPYPQDGIPLDAVKTLFHLTPLSWNDFVAWWRQEAEGTQTNHPPLPPSYLDFVALSLKWGGDRSGTIQQEQTRSILENNQESNLDPGGELHPDGATLVKPRQW